MRLKILDVSRESFIRGSNTVTAEVINSWKKGPAKGTFIFHAPASFCGTNFHVDRTYVVTGKNFMIHDSRLIFMRGEAGGPLPLSLPYYMHTVERTLSYIRIVLDLVLEKYPFNFCNKMVSYCC